MTGPDAPDPDILRDWLAEALGAPVHAVAVELLPAGYANGAPGPMSGTRRGSSRYTAAMSSNGPPER